MPFHHSIPTLVNDLAIAKKKLAYYEEKLTEMQVVEEQVKVLRARLVLVLEQSGFPEDTLELLLAVR